MSTIKQNAQDFEDLLNIHISQFYENYQFQYINF